MNFIAQNSLKLCLWLTFPDFTTVLSSESVDLVFIERSSHKLLTIKCDDYSGSHLTFGCCWQSHDPETVSHVVPESCPQKQKRERMMSFCLQSPVRPHYCPTAGTGKLVTSSLETRGQPLQWSVCQSSWLHWLCEEKGVGFWVPVSRSFALWWTQNLKKTSLWSKIQQTYKKYKKYMSQHLSTSDLLFHANV